MGNIQVIENKDTDILILFLVIKYPRVLSIGFSPYLLFHLCSH